MNRTELLNKIEKWFIDRNLHTLDGRGQLDKLEEEILELQNATTREEEIDAVGDIVVVLVGYCLQRKIDKYIKFVDLRHITLANNWKTDEILKTLNISKKELQDSFNSNKVLDEMFYIVRIVERLYQYCYTNDLVFWQCVESAYNEIKDRKGKVINGVFVKEVDL